MKRLSAAFRFIIDYFEHGDLVPFIVVVSAIHYSAILREHDHLIAAVSIGTLVDLGHYRWTKAAVKYSGENGWERVGRWVMVLVMSAIALNYQQRFYNDWWLSVPMPLLIASLAWLNQKESKPRQPGGQVVKPVKVVNPVNARVNLPNIDKANAAKAAKHQAHLNELATILENEPALSPVEIAARMNVSRQSVYNWTNELKAAAVPTNGTHGKGE